MQLLIPAFLPYQRVISAEPAYQARRNHGAYISLMAIFLRIGRPSLPGTPKCSPPRFLEILKFIRPDMIGPAVHTDCGFIFKKVGKQVPWLPRYKPEV